jgi:tetratricopeptide (TPR) repeat protein
METMLARHLVRVFVVVMGLALFAQTVSAQTPDPKAQAALEKYEAGKKAYNLGDFDKAIELWKEGYDIKDNSVFLFNLGQAYRQKQDYQKALFFYKAYLRENPNASNKAEVEAKLTDLQNLIKTQQDVTTSPPTNMINPNDPNNANNPDGTVKPVKPEATVKIEPPKPVVPTPGKGMRIAGLATAGAGVALLATGVIFSLSASSTAAELEDHVNMGGAWSQELSDKEASGKSKGTIGLVTMSLGTVCLVGGGVLYFMGAGKDKAARERHSKLQIIPTVSPSTAGVSLHLTF